MSTATLISVEQFAAMPRDEGVYYELVEGELVEVPSATPNHAWVRDELRRALQGFLSRNQIGIALTEVDCRTADRTVRKPDILFLSRERWVLVDGSRIPLPFAPDIAVEVLSPSEKALELNRKIAEYLAAGSLEVWVIDAENLQILIHTASGVRRLTPGDALESPLLPGFSIGVAEALAGPNLSAR